MKISERNEHHTHCQALARNLEGCRVFHFEERYFLDTDSLRIQMSERYINGDLFLRVKTAGKVFECNSTDDNALDELATILHQRLKLSERPQLSKIIFDNKAVLVSITRIMMDGFTDRWVDVFTTSNSSDTFAVQTFTTDCSTTTRLVPSKAEIALGMPSPEAIAPTELAQLHQLEGTLVNPTVLNLCRRVRSSGSDPIFCRWFIVDVITFISKLPPADRQHISHLNLSWCDLRDSDLSDVKRLIDILPCLRSVDLSANDFCGRYRDPRKCSVTKFITDVLYEHPGIEIDISRCFYATKNGTLCARDAGVLDARSLSRVHWLHGK